MNLQRRHLNALWLILSFAIMVGCSERSYTKVASKSYDMSPQVRSESAKLGGMAGMGGMEAELDDQRKPDNRKIIHTAKLSIVVENFDPVESSIAKIVKDYGGFISDSNIDTKNKKRRRGDWTVRIPVSKFESFLDEAGSIGVPVSRSRNAQDVTEEYVDVEARIANKKKLEARILELLERPDDKIQHVIEVEKELGRVREEIERMEGRMRYLTDRIALTTVELTIWEEKEYRPAESPTFSNRIASAWGSSITRTQRGFEDFAVWAVANAFVLLAWLVVGLVAWRYARRFYRKVNRGDA